MSKTNAERIAVVETKIDNVETKVDKVEVKVDQLHNKIDDFIECADKKYAEKERVNNLEESVSKMQLRMAKWSGAIIVLLAVVQLAINYFTG